MSLSAEPIRIAHISDLHWWSVPWNPLAWRGKRLLGLSNLLLRRRHHFDRCRLPDLGTQLLQDGVELVLISGDLTTTALPEEFRAVKEALTDWENRGLRLQIVPGNHDRYTPQAVRDDLFGEYIGAWSNQGKLPYAQEIRPGLVLIGLDPCRPHPFGAWGAMTSEALEKFKSLCEEWRGTASTVLVLCHYPAEVPQPHGQRNRRYGLRNPEPLLDALSSYECPVFWLHGHYHEAWRFQSPTLRSLMYLDPAPPLYRHSQHSPVTMGRWLLEWDGHCLKTEWSGESYVTVKEFFE